MFQGHRFRAVGSHLYPRPATETFHEFIIALLKATFGRGWLMKQAALPSSERHAVSTWLMGWVEQTKSARPAEHVEGHRFWAAPTGQTQELMALAFDLYKLRQVMSLPGWLRTRLRHPGEFQGARYELAVAATFVRCGFKIEWNRDKSRRGPEFTALNTISGEVIGVEAKSRRRRGTLNEAGATPELSTIRADVQNLVTDALGQHPGDKPFAIFVDTNVPPEVPGFQERFWEDAKGIISGFSARGLLQDPFSLLALTNCGWHYSGTAPSMAGSSYRVVVGKDPRFPIRSERALRAVVNSIGNSGLVPEED